MGREKRQGECKWGERRGKESVNGEREEARRV